jgi:hypothetical protein
MLGSKPGRLRLRHWQSNALTTRRVRLKRPVFPMSAPIQRTLKRRILRKQVESNLLLPGEGQEQQW